MKERSPAAKTVLIPFLLHILLVCLAYLLSFYLPNLAPAGFINPAINTNQPPIIDKLIRWDAHWYTYIVDYGYSAQSIVFFPAIIVLIKIMTYTGINSAISGLVVSNVFSLLSFWIMAKVVRLDAPEFITRKALLAYSVFPTAFFLNSIYTEPVFITFSLACIYSARQKRWWMAAIFAALAVLSRNIGIVLLIFLGLELLKSSEAARFKPALILPPAALTGFMLYNYWLTGSFIAFLNSQSLWGREFGLPPVNIYNNIKIIINTWPITQPGIILDLIMVCLTLTGLIILTFNQNYNMRRSYLVLGWLWLLIPLFSTAPAFPLYSLARFILVIFPMYLFLAQLPSPIFYSFLAISLLAMLLCCSLFMNWYWVG